jgi:hypothetical protein
LAAVKSTDKPEGWSLDVMPITPQRLLGGERNLVIMGGAAAGMFVFQIAPRMTGSFAGVPMLFVVVAIGIAFFFAWMGLVFMAWRIDPWMSKTLPRFLSLPKYMPAHSTGAASDPKRRMIRAKGLKR